MSSPNHFVVIHSILFLLPKLIKLITIINYSCTLTRHSFVGKGVIRNILQLAYIFVSRWDTKYKASDICKFDLYESFEPNIDLVFDDEHCIQAQAWSVLSFTAHIIRSQKKESLVNSILERIFDNKFVKEKSPRVICEMIYFLSKAKAFKKLNSSLLSNREKSQPFADTLIQYSRSSPLNCIFEFLDFTKVFFKTDGKSVSRIDHSCIHIPLLLNRIQKTCNIRLKSLNIELLYFLMYLLKLLSFSASNTAYEGNDIFCCFGAIENVVSHVQKIAHEKLKCNAGFEKEEMNVYVSFLASYYNLSHHNFVRISVRRKVRLLLELPKLLRTQEYQDKLFSSSLSSLYLNAVLNTSTNPAVIEQNLIRICESLSSLFEIFVHVTFPCLVTEKYLLTLTHILTICARKAHFLGKNIRYLITIATRNMECYRDELSRDGFFNTRISQEKCVSPAFKWLSSVKYTLVLFQALLKYEDGKAFAVKSQFPLLLIENWGISYCNVASKSTFAHTPIHELLLGILINFMSDNDEGKVIVTRNEKTMAFIMSLVFQHRPDSEGITSNVAEVSLALKVLASLIAPKTPTFGYFASRSLFPKVSSNQIFRDIYGKAYLNIFLRFKDI